MRIFLILAIGWLVAICVVAAAVVPNVVLPAQCALLGAAGSAIFGLGRIGRRAANESGNHGSWSGSALVLPVLRPVCGAALGWTALVVLTLLLRLIAAVPAECAGSVRVAPEAAWPAAFVAGFAVDAVRWRRGRGNAAAGGPLQDGENGYNDAAL